MIKRHSLPRRDRAASVSTLLAPRHQPNPRTAVAVRTAVSEACSAGALDPPTVIDDGIGPATLAEATHLVRIAHMRCVCCELLGREQLWPTEVHHIRQDREPRNHWLTIPLCGEGCHRGPRGVHGDRSVLRQLRSSEWGLLSFVMAGFYPRLSESG